MPWLSSTLPQLWVNRQTDGSHKPWKATHLGEGNTPKSNRVDKTHKFWLTAYLGERYLDSKISGPPGWGFSTRPTISPSKKIYSYRNIDKQKYKL
jgi:hypothetical protein